MNIKTRVEKLEQQVQVVTQPPADHAAAHAEIGASIMEKFRLAMAGELPPTPPPARPRAVQDIADLLMGRLAQVRARLAGTAVPAAKS